MEPTGQEPSAVIPPPVYKPIQLQSIEDFEREQDALDAERARTAKEKPQPLPKKAKKTVDLNALAAEQVAREEMGDVNWVGRLLGLSNPKFKRAIPLTNNFKNTAMHTPSHHPDSPSPMPSLHQALPASPTQ